MSATEENAGAPRDLEGHEEEGTPLSQDSSTASSSSTGNQEAQSEPGAGTSSLLDQIQKLRGEQQALKDEKKKLAKEMRNAQKKKMLQSRASQLSDVDLVEVLRMRKARKGAEGSGTAVQSQA